MEGRPLTDTNRRQEGEKVVLLVVNDIPGVPLLPLLWVAEPHSSGTEVPHAAASRPRAAPDRRNPDLENLPFALNNCFKGLVEALKNQVNM